MRRKLTAVDRLYVKAQARIRELEIENEYLRSMSSSGFARGTIKPAPKNDRTPKPEPEDML